MITTYVTFTMKTLCTMLCMYVYVPSHKQLCKGYALEWIAIIVYVCSSLQNYGTYVIGMKQYEPMPYCILPLSILQYVTRFWVKNIEYF